MWAPDAGGNAAATVAGARVQWCHGVAAVRGRASGRAVRASVQDGRPVRSEQTSAEFASSLVQKIYLLSSLVSQPLIVTHDRPGSRLPVVATFETRLSLSSSPLGSVSTTLYDATAQARRRDTHEQARWTAQNANIQSVTQDRISNAPSLSPVYTAAHTHENSYPYTPLPNCP